MAFKQGHKTTEMVTDDTQVDSNCNNIEDKCKIPTGTWLLHQYTKDRVLKLRLGTYIPPPIKVYFNKD